VFRSFGGVNRGGLLAWGLGCAQPRRQLVVGLLFSADLAACLECTLCVSVDIPGCSCGTDSMEGGQMVGRS